LAQGHSQLADLANITDCPAESLERLLQALLALDMVSSEFAAGYQLTERGQLLRSDTAFNVHGHALWWSNHTWDLWRDLYGSVRTGRNARERLRQQTGFDHLDDPIAAKVFHRTMVEQTQLITAHVAASADIPQQGFIVDVGGGTGALLCALLAARPTAQGAVLDLAHAELGARDTIAAAGLAGRAHWLTGDFFAPLDLQKAGAKQADTVLLKSILHDWDDARAVQILQQSAAVLASDGRVVIIERVLPLAGDDPSRLLRASRSDLNMLVGLSGRERSLAQYQTLLQQASLSLSSVAELPDAYSLLVAKQS
jgi:ubiquinone/menaquinone biosynthesis C-methylase UbiE